MKLTKIRQLADKLLASRGLRLSPRFSYGYSLALDIRMIWSDLNLDTPQTVVDIGANTGMFSKEISGYFPETRILAVEPNPDLHNLLRKNARLEVIESAISASKGLASLNYYRVNGEEDTPICSLTQSDTFAELHGLHPSRQREVCTTTLDRLASDYNLNLVDILKIDVEGLELDVLKGGLPCSSLSI